MLLNDFAKPANNAKLLITGAQYERYLYWNIKSMEIEVLNFGKNIFYIRDDKLYWSISVEVFMIPKDTGSSPSLIPLPG